MNTINDSLKPVPRRGLVGALVAGGAAAMATAAGAAQPAPTPTEVSRQLLRQKRSPNELLLDQHGRSVRFYDDVLKNKMVVVNVMYTVCSNICTPNTRNLMEARRLLGAEAKDLHFVSMTLTPLSDPPEALREYKKLHGIGEDWTFLTGKPENIERVQRGLGLLSARDTDDLLSHSGMARLCDERNLRWTHLNTMLSGASIARMIRFELV
jgi:protein SCO1